MVLSGTQNDEWHAANMSRSVISKVMGSARDGLARVSSDIKTNAGNAQHSVRTKVHNIDQTIGESIGNQYVKLADGSRAVGRVKHDAKTRAHNVSGYLHRKYTNEVNTTTYNEDKVIIPTVNNLDLAVKVSNRYELLGEQHALTDMLDAATTAYNNDPNQANLAAVSQARVKRAEATAEYVKLVKEDTHIPVVGGYIDGPGEVSETACYTDMDTAGMQTETTSKTVDFDRVKLAIDRKAVNTALIKKRWFKVYSKLLNHIRIKYFMRSRDTTTIHNMVADARVWLLKNGHTCDTDIDYTILSASVMASFVVSEEELEFRKLLKDSNVLDGVKHLNATMSGDLGQAWRPILQRLGDIRNPLLSKLTLPSKPLV